MRPAFIPVGQIVNAHGIRGEVRVQPDGQDPAFLTQFQTFYLDGAPVTPTANHVHKSLVLMKFPGVDDMNAALALKGQPPMLLKRSESYIGTLIDDLVTKGTQEPYRIMTSRSEYRLLLRQDNADRRLTPIGYRLGLVPEERMQAVREKYEAVDREIRRLEHTGIPGSEGLNRLLAERGSAPVTDGARLIDLLRRPQMTYRELMTFDPGAPELPEDVAEQVEISVKYEGYIRRQEKQVEELRQLEKHRLPPDMEYSHIQGLRLEAREKLAAVRPLDLGQASRISGVSPADIAALMIWLHTRTERGDAT